jgi:hypothetical protein
MKHLKCLAGFACLAAAATVTAEPACDEEWSWRAAQGERRFMVLAGRRDIFYDGSGPAFVILVTTTDDLTQILEAGAVGIHADGERRPVFGAVPAASYDRFLTETGHPSDVMLRIEITKPQYDRALTVLSQWERRARENALLYPDLGMNNILLVKQATEGLNRCTAALELYDLDWGLDDEISENNEPLNVPLEYFRTLRVLNESLHVRDDGMPRLLAASPARSARPSEPDADHHSHHSHHSLPSDYSQQAQRGGHADDGDRTRTPGDASPPHSEGEHASHAPPRERRDLVPRADRDHRH